MKNLRNKVLSGIIWNGVQVVVNQGFSFIVRLVLAKILFPKEFGVVGMATVVIGLVQVLNDLGVGAALVQRKEEDIRNEHYHTAFWTGIGWSIFLFVLISFGVAPLAANFYKEPVLSKLIPILSIGILVGPMNLVNKAQLTKSMDFKKMAQIDTVSSFVAGVLALVLAYSGVGIWSLAVNALGSVIIPVPFYFLATNWFPSFKWDKRAFKDIFGFGIFTTGTNVINYFINNIDYLLIGKMLNAEMLGVYTLAFTLTDTFRSRLMSVINNVMYPLYGKKQDNVDSLKLAYLAVIRYNAVAIYPIMMWFLVLAKPIILLFFGNKWMASISPLEILSVSVMIHMLVNSNTALIRGIGKPKLEMNLQILKAVIFIPSLTFGIVFYGIIGAAWAILINKIIAVIIAQFTFKLFLSLKINSFELLASIKEPSLAALISGGGAYGGYYILHLNFYLVSVFFAVLYLTILWLMIHKEIKKLVRQIKSGSLKPQLT